MLSHHLKVWKYWLNFIRVKIKAIIYSEYWIVYKKDLLQDFQSFKNWQNNWLKTNLIICLIGLKYIDLSSHKINSISSYAFAFTMPSNEKLLINLWNSSLTYKSFENNSFDPNGRPTTLNLGANPNLQVLEESVFHSFLSNKANGHENHIDLTGSTLNRISNNSWLLENTTEFNLIQKITNALSPDGISFWKHTKAECDANKDPLKPI